MKKTFALLFTAFIFNAVLTLAAAGQIPEELLITKSSVGKVHLGMTVGEARKVWKDYKFERTSDGEFSALIAVKKGDQHLMTIYADEKGYLDERSPIQDDARIEFIEVWGGNFKTAEGVYPKMTVKKAEKVYGKVKQVTRSEIESREYAEFTRQPAGIDFRLDGRNGFAGVNYRRDDRGIEITDQYAANAFIKNILIDRQESVFDEEGQKETDFTSVYTDLKLDCKEQDSMEGGHVSYFCRGAGNYQIHYFDSATSYHFYVETLDRKWSASLTGMAMNKLDEVGKIQWRLADGEPFAVILPVEGGDKVVVKGLKGFERINYREEGRGAISRARTFVDNDYPDIVLPAIRVEFTEGLTERTVENFIEKKRDKVKYVVKGKKGYRMTVRIYDVQTDSIEGPVMVGIVVSPSGKQDGQPGGLVFDSVLEETGDYEILVSQNAAKSAATNIRFKVKITQEPVNKK